LIPAGNFTTTARTQRSSTLHPQMAAGRRRLFSADRLFIRSLRHRCQSTRIGANLCTTTDSRSTCPEPNNRLWLFGSSRSFFSLRPRCSLWLIKKRGAPRTAGSTPTPLACLLGRHCDDALLAQSRPRPELGKPNPRSAGAHADQRADARSGYRSSIHRPVACAAFQEDRISTAAESPAVRSRAARRHRQRRTGDPSSFSITGIYTDVYI
jgi:hypothetical protein